MDKSAINCFFVSDLHGHRSRFEKLFTAIREEQPELLFLGGDLLPSVFGSFEEMTKQTDFVDDFLVPNLRKLKSALGAKYPTIFVILGNDDALPEEDKILEVEKEALWKYVHNQRVSYENITIYGYSFIPPTPFQYKDWEKYDVSRFVDPGSISPEEGVRSKQHRPNYIKYSTIKKDLELLVGNDDLERAVFLFHAPPYKSNLDRAALDDKFVDHVPLDVHVGSIAIREFVEQRKPLLTLHGHIHESTRLMGAWKDRIGQTPAYNAAHDGKELSLVKFDLNDLEHASRLLI